MTMKDTRKYKQTELGLMPEDWDVLMEYAR